MGWMARHAASLCAALLCASLAGQPATPRLRSGMFEGLMLAVDAQGGITGYYREDQGEGVVKRCAFFLAGKVAAGESPVVTWNQNKFPGSLTPRSDGVKLRVEQGREHPGCGLVLLPQIASGLELDLVGAATWQELRRIADARADLHSAPREGNKTRAYLVRGDVVGVIAEAGDWLHVEYPNKGKMTRGWVRASGTKKLTVPDG